MKIIITGALGHIGSRLIREIPRHFPGSDIIMIDNLSTLRYCSLFNLSDYCNFKFIEADITHIDLKEYIVNADVVVHLAAITDAAHSFHIREKVALGNFSGTKTIARLCRKNNVPMIHISSTSVYGSQSSIMDENCSEEQLKPQSPYAATKLKEENLLSEYKERGLKYTICRFGTVCGISSGVRFNTTVNKLCWQGVMGQPLTVWRTAQFQKRPYLTLQDAVDAIIHIIKKELYDCKIYNILTENMTVNDLLDIICKFLDNVEISYVDSEMMNQLSYEVSNKRFKDTGFRFRGSLESSIQTVIKTLYNSGTHDIQENAPEQTLLY
jgi:nucleoside-diphosphate-sugar epimerase